MITEMISDRTLVGTALTIQTGSGFLISVISIFLVPLLSSYISWTWLFAFLSPGPLCSILCMVKILMMERRKKRKEEEVEEEEVEVKEAVEEEVQVPKQ